MFDFLQQRIQLAVASGQPLLLVLAGSNSAGKSTFHAQARRHIGLPFCMETVLSDTHGAKLSLFADAQLQGYFLLLIHIRISDVFVRTRENAARALAIADAGFVFDNSNPASPYQLVEVWQEGKRLE